MVKSGESMTAKRFWVWQCCVLSIYNRAIRRTEGHEDQTEN